MNFLTCTYVRTHARFVPVIRSVYLIRSKACFARSLISSCCGGSVGCDSRRGRTDDRPVSGLQATLFTRRGFEVRLWVRDDGEGGAVGGVGCQVAGDGDFEGFEG